VTELHVEKASGPAADTAPRETGFKGLMAEVQRDSYRRLGWLATVMGGLMLVLLPTPLVLPAGVERNLAIEWNSRIVLLVLSAGVALLCRRKSLPAGLFPVIALSYEVAVGAVIGTEFLAWPETLGTGTYLGVPRATVWVIFFANVVPLRPRDHLAGAILVTAAVLAWFGVSIAMARTPPAEDVTRTLFVEIVISMAVTVFLAWVSARRVYGLSRALSRARQVGSYQLVQELGRGGMGEVWRAEHRMLARPAAIKLIRTDRVAGSTPSEADHYLERFQREVQATASLRSPHTIEVYDYGITPERSFYYVMELLDGVDLEGLVKTHGPLPAGRAVHMLRQTCHSLAEAHDAGLIHRDIKPANIFVCRYGRDVDHVKVLDFGLVKKVKRMDDSALTQMGTFAGTPAFGSPERPPTSTRWAASPTGWSPGRPSSRPEEPWRCSPLTSATNPRLRRRAPRPRSRRSSTGSFWTASPRTLASGSRRPTRSTPASPRYRRRYRGPRRRRGRGGCCTGRGGRRADGRALPVVGAPPAPIGTARRGGGGARGGGARGGGARVGLAGRCSAGAAPLR
jgi:serine/threonine-protein kinase